MDLFLHPKLFRILRFLVSGGASAFVNLVVLYSLTEYVGLWYMVSGSVAFVCSFFVSFTLQKFWTFRDNSMQDASRQVFMYLGVGLTNYVINSSMLYVLVEYAHLHYILAALIAMLVIACASFFIYRHFIFKVETSSQGEESDFFLSFSHALVIVAVALCAVLLPFGVTTYQMGESPTLPVGLLNDTDYYYDRMHEIIDGYPFLGNPYFYEHRNDPPPAFVGADWLAAVPLFLGIPLMQVIYLNIFGWSLIFLLIAYALVRAWDGTPMVALSGAILAYCSSYSLMLRPVSMQVVFPFFLFFLLGYLLWLRVPEGRAQQILFGLSAALAATLYTYAWQIIFVVFVLTAVAYAILRRDAMQFLVLPTSIFVVILAPSIVMTIVQTNHPLYAETLARIGLIKTHLPILLGFVIPIVPLSVAVLAFIIRPRIPFRKWIQEPVIMFFALTAIAITGVMLSNIITGLDLELPQHVERFIIVWFALVTVYLAPQACLFLRTRTRTVIVSVLVLVISVAHLHYQKAAGIGVLFTSFDVAQMRAIQKYDAPLSWLREHEKEPSVIWVDPESRLLHYVTITTPHYVLFHKGGGLHIVSDNEMEDRYLVSHYFSLTEDQLIADYQQYGGTGNAIHPYKTHNRKVRLCTLLHLDVLGYACGTVTDMVTFKGPEYFDDLFARYQNDIRPNIAQKLAEYHVRYIVADRFSKSSFTPEKLSRTSVMFDDGNFIIYELK